MAQLLKFNVQLGKGLQNPDRPVSEAYELAVLGDLSGRGVDDICCLPESSR
jgi:hypothetical protein